jgi:Peptidase M50B-like
LGKTGIVGDGLRAVLVVLIGYLGPSLFGMGAAKLIAMGYPLAVLWLLVLLLVLVLSLLGRSFAVLSVPVAIALLYVILRYTHDGTEVVAGYVVAWLLLLSGLRPRSATSFAPIPPTRPTCAALPTCPARFGHWCGWRGRRSR